MGYRSEYAIVFPKRFLDEILEAVKDGDDSRAYWRDFFAESEREVGEKDILFYNSWTKIYAEDERYLYALLIAKEIPYRSLRLGEDEDDNEWNGYYLDEEFDLCLTRSINFSRREGKL